MNEFICTWYYFFILCSFIICVWTKVNNPESGPIQITRLDAPVVPVVPLLQRCATLNWDTHHQAAHLARFQQSCITLKEMESWGSRRIEFEQLRLGFMPDALGHVFPFFKGGVIFSRFLSVGWNTWTLIIRFNMLKVLCYAIPPLPPPELISTITADQLLLAFHQISLQQTHGWQWMLNAGLSGTLAAVQIHFIHQPYAMVLCLKSVQIQKIIHVIMNLHHFAIFFELRSEELLPKLEVLFGTKALYFKGMRIKTSSLFFVTDVEIRKAHDTFFNVRTTASWKKGLNLQSTVQIDNQSWMNSFFTAATEVLKLDLLWSKNFLSGAIYATAKSKITNEIVSAPAIYFKKKNLDQRISVQHQYIFACGPSQDLVRLRLLTDSFVDTITPDPIFLFYQVEFSKSVFGLKMHHIKGNIGQKGIPHSRLVLSDFTFIVTTSANFDGHSGVVHSDVSLFFSWSDGLQLRYSFNSISLIGIAGLFQGFKWVVPSILDSLVFSKLEIIKKKVHFLQSEFPFCGEGIGSMLDFPGILELYISSKELCITLVPSAWNTRIKGDHSFLTPIPKSSIVWQIKSNGFDHYFASTITILNIELKSIFEFDLTHSGYSFSVKGAKFNTLSATYSGILSSINFVSLQFSGTFSIKPDIDVAFSQFVASLFDSNVLSKSDSRDRGELDKSAKAFSETITDVNFSGTFGIPGILFSLKISNVEHTESFTALTIRDLQSQMGEFLLAKI